MAVLMICSIADAANKGYSQKSITVIDEQGAVIPASEIRSITVYDAGTFTASTLYASKNGGTLTNPVLTSNIYYVNGGVQFWSAAPTFDVLVKTTKGGARAVGLSGSNNIVISKARNQLVTKRFTIGSVGDTGTDMVFTTAANTTEQVVNTGAVIPPFARIVDVSLINTEAAVVGVTTLVAKIGTASGGDQIAASATIYAANAILGPAATAIPVASAATATTIYVSATPGGNWSTMTAGQWTLVITYLDVEPYR